MTSIYCLYAVNDGRPRYIGQTTKPVTVRLTQHLLAARRGRSTPLCRWLRATLAAGFPIKAHTMQTRVPPADLGFFERYWMAQFVGLVNAGAAVPRVGADSPAASALIRALRNEVDLAHCATGDPNRQVRHASSARLTTVDSATSNSGRSPYTMSAMKRT